MWDFFNTRAIRKTKIIDMLSADRENEPELKKSRFLPAVTLLYLLVMAVMLVNSVRIRHYYFLILATLFRCTSCSGAISCFRLWDFSGR